MLYSLVVYFNYLVVSVFIFTVEDCPNTILVPIYTTYLTSSNSSFEVTVHVFMVSVPYKPEQPQK